MAIPLTSSLITVPPRILFSGGGGTGALAEAAVSSAGVITSVIVTNGGSGYTSAPTVSILGGGGSGATATATVSGGVVTGVTVTSGGTGYNQGAPGVVLRGVVNPGLSSLNNLQVVEATNSARRISEPIDPAYIVDGNVAYLSRFLLDQSGRIQLNTSDEPTSLHGTGLAGPQFTEDAEDSLWFVFFYGSTNAAWEFAELDASDEEEPFIFDSTSVSSAGPSNTLALRTAIDADTTVMVMVVDGSHPSINITNMTYEAAPGTPLDNPLVTSSTPGIAVKGVTNPVSGGNPIWLNIVRGVDSVTRISDTIDSSYIEGGGTAYWTGLHLRSNGTMRVLLSTSSSDEGHGTGPQLTQAARDNFWIIVFYGSTHAAWQFSELDASDTTEPYEFTATSVSAAGPTVNTALINAINADSSVSAMMVDGSHNNIDISNLRTALANDPPTQPTAPTVTSTGQTSVSVTLSSDPASDATITSRDIRHKRTADGDSAWTETTGITSPHSITGLTAATEYEVQWRAVSSAGDGEWSPSGTATTDSADLLPTIDVIDDIDLEHGGTLNVTLQDPGGDSPVTLVVTGRPSWIQFDPVSRALTGTAPNSVGSWELTYQATDADNDVASRTFTVRVLLGLSDLDTTGLFTEAHAVLQALRTGTNSYVWSVSPHNAGNRGSLLDGEMTIDGTTIPLNAVRFRSGSSLGNERISIEARDIPGYSSSLRDYFTAADGAGQDLTLHVVSATHSLSFGVTGHNTRHGSDWIRWDLTGDEQDVLASIASGDRFIFALTRANTAPIVTFTTASSTVAGESVTTITGTATDVEDINQTLDVSLSTTLGTLSDVTRTGDNWSATLTAPAATTSTQSMTVTATVTDSGGATSTATRTWTVIATSTGTAPTITFTTASSTVAGNSATTIEGTVSDAEDADSSLDVSLSTTLGTLSAVTRSGSTWSAVLTAPAATSSTQTMTVTATVTDSDNTSSTATRSWTVEASAPPEILTQEFVLGDIASDGQWTGSILINPEFVAGGGTAYFRHIDFVGSSSVRFDLSDTDGGSYTSSGPDFTELVEDYAESFTFVGSGGTTFVMPGPNYSGNQFQDDAERYFWTVPSSLTLPTWNGNNETWTITLSDGQTLSNERPSIEFTTATSILNGGQQIGIAGTVNDAEDDNASLNVQISTNLGTLTNTTHTGSSWSTMLTAPAVTASQQTITVTATVTDSEGAVGTATRTWTVRANEAPTITLNQSDQNGCRQHGCVDHGHHHRAGARTNRHGRVVGPRRRHPVGHDRRHHHVHVARSRSIRHNLPSPRNRNRQYRRLHHHHHHVHGRGR